MPWVLNVAAGASRSGNIVGAGSMHTWFIFGVYISEVGGCSDIPYTVGQVLFADILYSRSSRMWNIRENYLCAYVNQALVAL